MSRFDTRWQMNQYETDFELYYKDFPFKIQKNAPLLAQFYDERQASVCASFLVVPRHLKATFSDGRVLKYPVSTEDLVPVHANDLLGEGAVCIDHIGEYWGALFGKGIADNFTLRTTPYNNLDTRGTKETGTFLYTSSLGVVGIDQIRLPYRITLEPNEPDLYNCQRAGLEDPKQTTRLCDYGDLIEPRHLIIRALAQDNITPAAKEKNVTRKAPVSVKTDLPGVADLVSTCAYCLQYQGESFKSIHLYV